MASFKLKILFKVTKEGNESKLDFSIEDNFTISEYPLEVIFTEYFRPLVILSMKPS